VNRRLVSFLGSRKIGYHGSRASRKRIFYDILLVTLVVSMLVLAQLFVVSMSNGIAEKYALLGNGYLQVHEAEVPSFSDLPQIYDVQQAAKTVALAYGAQANRMVQVKGVGEGYFNRYRLGQMSLEMESGEDGSSLPRVILGESLANLLSVGLGDRIALMMVGGEGKTTLRPQLCIVEGIYDSGYRELDENLVFCSYSLVEKVFGDQTDTYYELLVDEDAVDTTKQALKERGMSVTSWDEENYSVSENLKTSKEAILGVLVVVALLCGYFISEIANEMVEDDKHRIALLKLLGATDRLVGQVYFSTVMFVTLCSLVAGTVLGISLGINLGGVLGMLASRSIPALSYYLLDFAPVVPVAQIAIILLVLATASAVSVLLSLRRIGKIALLDCIHFD
jgi:lipoprotein-releasing system permease protein